MTDLLPKSAARLVVVISLTFLVSCMVPIPLAKAQSTSGTISGHVFDLAGRPLPGAKVTVVNRLNGNTRATLTDKNGYYSIPFLPVGIYSVTVSLPGFADNGYPEVRIELNKTNVVLPPIKLAPATVTASTSTTVQSGGQIEISILINTTDATRRGNYSDTQVVALPLGGTTDIRTFDEFALLVPGVAPPPHTPGIRGPGIGFGIGSAGQFSVNGARARSNNFTVDGSDNNDPDVGVRRQTFIALVPQSIESVKEFQISTLLSSAELGRNLGSQVNVVSKSGGNAFHGQVYGFFTDSSLNARNFFDYSGGASGGENPYTRTQTGFVIGGPVSQNHTQFFGSFEHQDVNASMEQHFSSPTLTERNFRLFLGRILNREPSETFAVQPPFPNSDPPNLNFGTPLGATPLGDNILSFYPLPNNPGGPYSENTYTEILPADGEGTLLSFKITHEVASNNSLNARYNFSDDNRILPSVNRAIRSTIESDTRAQNLSLIFDSALSPTLFNQARFSYGRTRLDFFEYQNNPLLFQTESRVSVGNSILPSRTGPIGEVIIEPFSPVGIDVFIFPQGRANNTFQYADSMSWNWRAHTFKFGGDIRRVQFNSFQDRNYRSRVLYGNGILVFGNFIQRGPFDPISFEEDPGQFLLPGIQLAAIGLPTSIFQTVTSGVPDSHIGLRQTEFNLFFNDNWRVRPNLTLDYGLRYEYNTVPRETNDRVEDAITLRNLPQPGSSIFDSRERTAAFNAAVGAYSRVLDGRTRIYDPDRNNFGPHLGFAWSPRPDRKLYVRGGYGIYYDAILGAVVSQSRNVFPNEIPINIDPIFEGLNVFDLNNPAFLQSSSRGRSVNLILPGTINQFGGAPQDFVALIGLTFLQNQNGGGLAFTLPEKNLRTPYAQQWHLTIEREMLSDYLISAAYVGTRGTKLTRLVTPNLGPNLTSFIPVALGQGSPETIFPIPPTVVANRARTVRRDRPAPALGAYQIFENSANSVYHALQLEARKRYSHGYTFTAAYTWSHALDDVSDLFPIAGAPILAQNSFNLKAERGDANFDVRQHFATSLIWDLPFHRNSTTDSARWFGGWQIATIFQAHTGQPFTINLPVDANLDGNLTDRPSTVDGLILFESHGPRRVAIAPGGQVSDFFILGQDGFVGRNTVRGDSFINWDIALTKNFLFTENQKLDLRAEIFNILNRANFGTPVRTLGSPAFGSAVETVNPARIIQFALKYSF